jgi:hypothetical protein
VATFADVPPGTGFELTVTTLPSDLIETVAGAATLSVTSGDTTSVDEQFTTRTVSGTVQLDNTGNSDPEEVAVGATVSLSAPGASDQTTDSSGQYTFASVPTGSWALTFSKSGYQSVTRNVSVTAGSLVENATLEKLASLTVNVDDDTGANVVGASVTITGPTNAGPVTTDGDGNAVFSGLDAGDYTIAVTMAGHFDGTGAANGLANKQGGAATVVVNRHATVTFTVTDGTNPVAGASVTMTATPSTPSDTTDVNGQVTFTGAYGPQDIDYEVTATDFDPASATAVPIVHGPNAIPVTLTLTP